MKNLIALTDDPPYLDRYVEIRDKKKLATRRPLAAAHELLQTRYAAYAQAVSNASLATLDIDSAALALQVALRSCYSDSTSALRKLKKAIIDAQPKRLLKYCPMCGTTLPGTFDHYLPAAKFPEFAVHPLNLVPCCALCNSIKDDAWLSADLKRQFLHFYTDIVPDAQFLHVTLHENPAFSGVGATFSLRRPEVMQDELWDLIEAHFDRLKLTDRYDELGNDEVGEILAGARSHRDSGGGSVRGFLSMQAADCADVRGKNHWIAVLMVAMAQHPRLMAWI